MDPESRALRARLPRLVADAPAVLVTVLDARGSVPRSAGAEMLVRDGRLVAGTIGGGHLEQRALDIAAEVQASGVPREEPFALGPELAQCCGGALTLGFRPVDATLAATLAEGLPEGRTVVVFGAGHVARALARALSPLPWRVVVVDGRPEFADPAAFPAEVEVVCREPAALLRAWGWPAAGAGIDETAPATPAIARTSALVMTHDHALDRALCWALLAIRDALGRPLDFVGLIGSKTKIAGTHRQMRDRLDDATLERLVAPIGLRLADGRLLGGKLPGEIAVSVAAQLVARAQDADADADA
jgi:xanthine dehydrogenase accessory protein XdhC